MSWEPRGISTCSLWHWPKAEHQVQTRLCVPFLSKACSGCVPCGVSAQCQMDVSVLGAIPVQSQLGPAVSTSKECSWAKMSRAVTMCAGSLYKRIHFHSPACLLQSKYNATAQRVRCQGRPQRANALLHLPGRSWPGPAAAPGARSSPCCESLFPRSWSSRAAEHSPAGLHSRLGERLSGALLFQREQEPPRELTAEPAAGALGAALSRQGSLSAQ